MAVSALAVLREWSLAPGLAAWATPPAVVALTGLLALQVGAGRRVFVLVALGLTAAAAALDPGWLDAAGRGLASAAFIAAFFAALSSLRSAAATSPAIARCGRFLAQQPPGRRYLALTAGGQLFALLLNYGAIALLGTLAMAHARAEPDPEIRGHRMRRMLLAVQRGFVSTLPWSPLSFAVAVSTSVVPGASWAGAVLPCLVSGLILAGMGWALDTIFKPRLARPAPPREPPEGGWASVLPLLVLLALIGGTVLALHLATGIRVPAVVIPLVPLIALGWVALQGGAGGALAHLRSRAAAHVTRELPALRGELVLLMMAAYIGVTGGHMLVPLVAGWGIDLSGLPAWAVLAALVWIVPAAGQAGMNPILAVSLVAPLLPGAEALGITPAAYVVALTAGWALSGASSPFTATTLLIGSFAGKSAWHVGLRWNGLYTLLAGLALTGWAVLHAAL